MTKPIKLSVPVLALALTGCASTQTNTRSGDQPNPITQAQVEAAQRGWCDALLSLSESGRRGGDSRSLASNILSTAYNYDRGPVLFKPTLTHGAQTFRMDKQGALAYFVGGDPTYPSDDGFALKDWTRCRPEVRGVVQDGAMAIAMGNVHLENGKGDKVMVDKTFGYQRAADGSLVIVLHHSSLPFTPR
ncbi:MAG: phosphoribosyl-AMP cyclohydrolase [Deltaproteobacteria bacterium]|nr:phosphoribosyl-AMP cyclohydrolase [Deltaproteobacteria bacterium]